MIDETAPADLDDPIGSSLRTAHARFAVKHGSAIRYRSDVSPFCSVGLRPAEKSWTDLRELLAGVSGAMFMDVGFVVPDVLRTVLRIPLTQMLFAGSVADDGEHGALIRELGAVDVPEMIRLVAATEPGPFEHSTYELGGYVGIFDGDRLVAMAGQRMNPPSFIEVSAVCTDKAYRGRGYARILMLEVIRRARREGNGVFLHVAHGNPARALYENLGFVARKDFEVLVVQE